MFKGKFIKVAKRPGQKGLFDEEEKLFGDKSETSKALGSKKAAERDYASEEIEESQRSAAAEESLSMAAEAIHEAKTPEDVKSALLEFLKAYESCK